MSSFRHEIVQAPMANVQPPSLAAAASEAGALGSVAGAALSADALRDAIREVRSLTDEAFAVNLFAPPYLREGALEVVLEERPAVFSFTFGLIDPEPLQAAGIAVVGTATTSEEASALAAAGVDAVVAQGAEAGGHRGTFLGSFEDGLVPIDELLESIDVDVPVLAAGGIVDASDVRRVRERGAAGVQVGTAFLFTDECETSREHLDALRRYDTVVTPAYTGRHMRAARTPVLDELMQETPLPFPEQRAVAARRGPLFMGGTSAKRCREQSVRDLVAELASGFE
ncbi:MAG TPA: nitronate monooxygenase [Gaiellaceae bacterium]|nr:nitronate monooxygenase [Gaiellaceae bacterium]